MAKTAAPFEWEAKAVSFAKHNDHEMTTSINREMAGGWALVSVVAHNNIAQFTAFFQRLKK